MLTTRSVSSKELLLQNQLKEYGQEAAGAGFAQLLEFHAWIRKLEAQVRSWRELIIRLMVQSMVRSMVKLMVKHSGV